MIHPKNDLRARVERTSAEPTEPSEEINNAHCTSTHTPLLTYTLRGFMMLAPKPDALRVQLPHEDLICIGGGEVSEANFPTSTSSL